MRIVMPPSPSTLYVCSGGALSGIRSERLWYAGFALDRIPKGSAGFCCPRPEGPDAWLMRNEGQS